MNERKPPSTELSLLADFVVGSVTVGFVVLLILHGVKTLLGATRSGGAALPPLSVFGGSFAQPIQPSALATAMQLGDGTPLATRTDTLSLSPTAPMAVFTAPNSGPMWRVRINVLGPAGGFASLAIDAVPSASGGNSAVIPAGGFTELFVGPRQAISGLGINGTVQISYVASAGVV